VPFEKQTNFVRETILKIPCGEFLGPVSNRGGYYAIYAEGFRSHIGWGNSKPYHLVQWVSEGKMTWIIEENPLLWSLCAVTIFTDIAHMTRWSQCLEDARRRAWINRSTKACKTLAVIYERMINCYNAVVISGKSLLVCQYLSGDMFTTRRRKMTSRKSRSSEGRKLCWLGAASDYVDAPRCDQDATKHISSKTFPGFDLREEAIFQGYWMDFLFIWMVRIIR
jgi:hypothetical protein